MQFDRRKLIVWCAVAFLAGFGGAYSFVHGMLDGEAAARAAAQHN